MTKSYKEEIFPPAYLVWSQNKSGIVYLRAVYTEEKKKFATYAMKACEQESYTVRAWIEETQCNHFFGEQFRFPNRFDRTPEK